MNEALTQSIEQWLTSTNRFSFRLFCVLHAAPDVRTVYNTTQAAHLPATPTPFQCHRRHFVCRVTSEQVSTSAATSGFNLLNILLCYNCCIGIQYKNIYKTHNSYVLNENKGFSRVRSNDCRSWVDANKIRIITFDFFNSRNTILLCRIN